MSIRITALAFVTCATLTAQTSNSDALVLAEPAPTRSYLQVVRDTANMIGNRLVQRLVEQKRSRYGQRHVGRHRPLPR